MNIKMSGLNFLRRAWLFAVLLAAGLPISALPAQPAERTVPGRFLLIFDTSANMKKRLPAVEKSLNTMLATSMSGQLHKGDTMGVWTLDQTLHPGDYPLLPWNPEDAALIASNLTQFIHSRKYANATHFEVLQPLLGRVVDSSERLTVLIFCDGATKITGTTFDTGINQLFAQNAAAQKKAKEPFVVVLRSQQGKYVGCTVTYAPQLVAFPQFPPLPPLPEPPPEPKPAPVAAPTPAIVVPSMVIIGTNVEGRQPSAATKPAPTPPPATEPAPASVAPVSAPVVEPEVAPVVPPVPAVAAEPATPTNPAPATLVTPTPAAPTTTPVPTNHPATADANSSGLDKKSMFIGAICVVAAGIVTALVVWLFRRPDQRSLISRSMNDK